jgi:hypothetical protein
MKKYLTISVMTVFIVAVFFVFSNAAPSSNSNKNGWKFLTWGMSINETNTLLVKNGMKPMKNMTDSYNHCTIVYGNEWKDGESFSATRIECFKSDLPSHHGDDVFSFYFIDNKLEAVAISYEHYSSEYMDTVIEKLRNNFPSGTIEGTGINKNFSYVDNNIIVHNRPDRHRKRYVWYVNPDVIKIKNAIETLKKREKKESEDRREKLF